MRSGKVTVWALGLVACLVACGGADNGATDGGQNDEGSGGSASDSGHGGAESLGYCDVKTIIEARCLRCHGETLENGAPFSLSRYQDLVDPAAGDEDGEPIYQRMQGAIEAGFMPATFIKLEPPVLPLEEGEKAKLLDWLSAGAPLGAGCVDD